MDIVPLVAVLESNVTGKVVAVHFAYIVLLEVIAILVFALLGE